MEDDPKKPDDTKAKDRDTAASEEDFSLDSLVKRNSRPGGYKADDVGQTALPYQQEFIDKLKRIYDAADGIPPPPPQRQKDPLSLDELKKRTLDSADRKAEGPRVAGIEIIKESPAAPSPGKNEIAGGALENWFMRDAGNPGQWFKGKYEKPLQTKNLTEALYKPAQEEAVRQDARAFKKTLGGPFERWVARHKSSLRKVALTAALAVAGVIGAHKLFPPPSPDGPPAGPREGVTDVQRTDRIELGGMTIVDPLEAQIERLAHKVERDSKNMLEAGPATAGVLDGASVPGMDKSQNTEPTRAAPGIKPFQGERSGLKDFNAKAETGPKTPPGLSLASLAVPEGPDRGADRNDRVSAHRILSKAEIMKKNPDGSPKPPK